MSEHLHPHVEPWDDMPMPNEEEAWQKMKGLLDKEDRRRRLLPLWFWRYALLGLLLFGASTGSYFLLKKDHDDRPSGIRSTNNPVQQQEGTEQEVVRIESAKKKDGVPRIDVPEQKDERNQIRENRATTVMEQKREVPDQSISVQQVRENKIRRFSNVKSIIAYSGGRKLRQKKKIPEHKKVPANRFVPKEREEDVWSKIETGATSNNNRLQKQSDSVKQIDTTKAARDSISTRDSTKTISAPPVVSSKVKEGKTKKKSRLLFSAGVGLQQAIAISGQQSSSYNLNGKQNKLSDHIPSVYLRLQKEKWFLQGEFHYSVPQPVKPLSFSQTTSYNAFSAELRTEKASIQKLYYHQLPFSINYFLLPAWSWGAGGTYNLLAGAITEKQTESKNVTTGGETISNSVVPLKGYTDSFLYKSTVGVLLQTDYHWKRFSVGLRYTKNLQPFIKYTQTDGTVMDESSHALQAVLRFRIK